MSKKDISYSKPETIPPYRFIKRKSFKPSLHVGHERLQEGRFDLAFEIEWRNLTPLACNPCTDHRVSPSPFSKPEEAASQYLGFDKRWLVVEGRLALSPFTVKSAIANAYANLVGGCYRVTSNVERHPPKVEEGHYYYTGKFKRYRVAMDGSSKPGIIKKLTVNLDGSREVEIQPIEEYYLDDNLLDAMKFETLVNATIKEKRGFKPPIIGLSKESGSLKLYYLGPYKDGMDAQNNYKNHKHRFFRPIGSTVTGTIRPENFWNAERLKEIVYMGDYKKEGKGKIWYEDLTTLKVNDFVYYEVFNGRVTNIGKNFLFKALFCIEDAIPEGQRLCSHPDSLCPRCKLFGMVGVEGGGEHLAYKGRFKSSTLLGPYFAKESSFEYSVPQTGGKRVLIRLSALIDDSGNIIARQYLLPIMGQPKANKRDVNGYYDKNTGMIKGAKIYHHSNLDLDKLVQETDRMQKLPYSNLDYTHSLRSFAYVLTAINKVFSGVIGAENVSIDECAALILLLHSEISGNAFKIGVGKPLGMGTMFSSIGKVWIRKSYKHQGWVSYDSLEKFLESETQVANQIRKLGSAAETRSFLNSIQIENGRPKLSNLRLAYPQPGLRYWRDFNQSK